MKKYSWILFFCLWNISYAGESKDRCRVTFARLNEFINSGFTSIKMQPVLSQELELRLPEKLGSEFFDVAHMLWKANPVPMDLLTLLKQAERTGEVPPALGKSLSRTRARFKIIRFLCEAICENPEKMQKALDAATKDMGQVQDALKFGKVEDIQAAAKKAQKALREKNLDEISHEVKEMKSKNKTEFLVWLAKAKKSMEKSLEKKEKLTEEEFHEVRKNLGRIQTVLLFDGLAKGDQSKLDSFEFMREIYDKLGVDHDKMVEAEWHDKEIGEVLFSPEIQAELRKVLQVLP